MEVQLAYGRNGLNVRLPDGCDVVTSRFVPGVADEKVALQQSLRKPIGTAPLSDKVRASDKVVIVHSDITRATPNDRILPVILAELELLALHAKISR